MPEVTVVEILKGARDRIAAGWCQGAGARTADGWITMVDSPDAASYCILGALHAVRMELVLFQDNVGWEAEWEARRRLCEELRSYYHPHYGKRLRLHCWNDQKRRTQAEVVALFEETIAGLK